MTETDLLRRMLNERGVEWEAFDDFEQTTQWSTHNGAFVYWARERDGKLLVETTAPTKGSASCTPEQAITATLGSAISGFWTHDGTLHVTCGRVPERIEVTLPDERGREIHSARVHEFERSEECKNMDVEGGEWFACSECNTKLRLHAPFDSYNILFCPNCGRRVVE